MSKAEDDIRNFLLGFALSMTDCKSQKNGCSRASSKKLSFTIIDALHNVGKSYTIPYLATQFSLVTSLSLVLFFRPMTYLGFCASKLWKMAILCLCRRLMRFRQQARCNYEGTRPLRQSVLSKVVKHLRSGLSPIMQMRPRTICPSSSQINIASSLR